jgi:endonuclease/exonuclease/phosphatase family metal-dependent hydrolase
MYIITYNILSAEYVEDYPLPMDEKTRHTKIMKKLKSHIKDKPIVCLQEVSPKWIDFFQEEFVKCDYTLVWSFENHTKCLCIAYPHKCCTALNTLDRKLNSLKKKYKENDKQWMEVARRKGRVLGVLFSNETKKFAVSTCHLPCSYNNIEVMNTFVAFLFQHTYKFSEGYPYIIAGDFNFKPYDPSFLYAVTGKLQGKRDFYKEWSFELPRPMKEVLSTYYPTKTLWTNRKIENDGTLFQERLDYIFTTPEFSIEDVFCVGIEDKETMTMTEPSDHLLVKVALTNTHS